MRSCRRRHRQQIERGVSLGRRRRDPERLIFRQQKMKRQIEVRRRRLSKPRLIAERQRFLQKRDRFAIGGACFSVPHLAYPLAAARKFRPIPAHGRYRHPSRTITVPRTAKLLNRSPRGSQVNLIHCSTIVRTF